MEPEPAAPVLAPGERRRDAADAPKTRPKQDLPFVIVGFRDAGKATLLGRLAAHFFPSELTEKVLRDAKEMGKETLAYARLGCEMSEMLLRTKGAIRYRALPRDVRLLTVDTPTATLTFATGTAMQNLLGTTCSSISSMSPRVVIVVVSAVPGHFEASASLPSLPWLPSSLGIGRIVVVVSQMDNANVQWSQARFDEIQTFLDSLLRRWYRSFCGLDLEALVFVPVSLWYVDNVFEPSTKMPWWGGPPLLPLLLHYGRA
jgi:translation elongation factor EF-1alpha